MTSPREGGDRLTRHALVVAAVERAAEDVLVVSLAQPDGTPLPPWEPGDHLDLELAPGLTRQYSLCSDPADAARWSVAVRLDPAGGGGSRFVHEVLGTGHSVRVSGPKHRFPLEPAAHHTLVAGGIGITPVVTMAEALAAAGAPFSLTYFGRGRARMPFLDRLERLAAAPGAAVTVVDRAQDGGAPAVTVEDALAGRPAGSLVYACGPVRLLEDLARLVDDEALRTEAFTAPAPTAAEVAEATGGAAEAEAPTSGGGDGAFEVQLGAGGPVHPVPAHCSLLDVLLGAGVDLMWSCREGNCASCEVGVLEGEPDHRDVVLTEEERAAGDAMFPCVSRARSPRLVLDL